MCYRCALKTGCGIKKERLAALFLIAQQSELHVELGRCQEGVAVGSTLPAWIVDSSIVAYQALINIDLLAIKVGHAKVNAHIGVDMVGGASAIPDTI